MFGKSSSQYPSDPPRPRDQHNGPSQGLSLSHLIGLLSRYPVGGYILLIAVMGGLLYTGYRLGQSGNWDLLADPAVLSESGDKVTGLGPDPQAARTLQEMSEKYSQLEAQFKERETVISSLRNEIKALQSKIIAEHRMNTELLAQRGPSDKTNREFQQDRIRVPRTLHHKGFQMQFSSIIAPKGYLIWAPEQSTENGFYIDGTHYALFKCLQKVEPRDLLGEVERRALFFAITVGGTVLSPVPYLHMLPVEEGTHKIKIEPLSGATENNAKEAVVKLMARQVEFIEIDGIDVLSGEGGARVKLKSFDLGSAVQGLAKALAKMDVDNDCLLEVLTTR
jgi:hypothetical protein